jgi:hypothetical protein
MENGHRYVIHQSTLSRSSSSSLSASHHEGPQVPAGQPLQERVVLSDTDSSGPLFHMYIKMTEGEDEKMAHRWQKDADGILIFVSPYIDSTLEPSDQRKFCRLVYSLLHSLHCSLCPFKT